MLGHASRTSQSSAKNVQAEAKKLPVLPLHSVTRWESTFIIRVVQVKGEEQEAALPHQSTGNQDDRNSCGALDPGTGSLTCPDRCALCPARTASSRAGVSARKPRSHLAQKRPAIGRTRPRGTPRWVYIPGFQRLTRN